MGSFETSLLEHKSPDVAMSSEEIADHFDCCVCLDLLFKPIVLHCGHISCFWCVHKSMSSRSESHCPICRNPYSHFPAICQMLHFLLLKLYPITYKEREDQILEEEKRDGYLSPEFNGHAHELQADGEFNYIGSPGHSSAYLDSPSTSKEKLSKPAGQVESHYNGTARTKENSDGDLNQIKPVAGEEKDQVSVVDLLFYCQTCIIEPADEMLRCQVCQCLHPRGFPKVCLTLDQFLVAKFPKEYALRRDAVQLKQVSSENEGATTCSMEAGKQVFSPIQLPNRNDLPFSVEPGAYKHIGVGCDACGMFPIVGDRYECKDCTEIAGFDLCGDCYNTRPKLPGRFNQRHTPEHEFELIKRDNIRRLRLMSEQLEIGFTSFFNFDDALENLENGPVGNSQDNTSNTLAAVLDDDDMEDQDDILFPE
ncbi:hypothetical protein CRYUN_Cryun23aG0064600 [Craigia yunnanensis]